MDTCEECGFVYRLDAATDVPAALRTTAGQLATIVRARAPRGRERTDPATWSPLEYACHVRDVLLVQRERVLAARREPRPTFTPMGRDERVDHDGYRDQHPDDVARQLVDAAALFANVLERLSRDDWERTVMFGYPTPAERSLRWVAAHTHHEVHHHLGDVTRQLREP